MSLKQVLIIGWQYLRAFALLYLLPHYRKYDLHTAPVCDTWQHCWYANFIRIISTPACPLPLGTTGMYSAIKNMTLLFVPIGVGIMNYYGQVSQQIVPILVACFISTFVVMVVVAYSSHYIHRERPITGAKPDEVPLPPETPDLNEITESLLTDSKNPQENKKC